MTSPRSQSRGGILPHLRTTYDDSYQPTVRYAGGGGGGGGNRLEDLEARLVQAESSLRSLLEKSVKMKSEIMENMTYTHGSWQEEKDARELLQDHIKTVTAVVKQMGKDIKHLEDEIKQRDQGITGQSTALKTLETHHVAGITDLRGRVARCDASIGKLAADLKQNGETVRMLSQSENEEHQRLKDRLAQMERSMAELHSFMERVGMENTMQVKASEETSSKNISQLDVKTRQVIAELTHQLENLSKHVNAEVEKLETRVYAYLDKHIAARDARMDKIEADHLDFEKSMFARLAALEEDHQKHKSTTARAHQELESKVQQFYDSFYRAQNSELVKLKRELREGFSTVHETVSSMRSVTEGKIKLLEESLRKDIAQIRKMVVLI
ncbi:hypothetical protein BOX15_Mlig013284g1 [Macrostomum lignano]|uniref:Protein FAM81A n=1 Tax=Macrostomum lignano TaxID=282301 RepID=A0A267GVP9_9PLAT|nr:hypothetical protein BOX15_Mlig013284g1 [Macrostomum lignano]